MAKAKTMKHILGFTKDLRDEVAIKMADQTDQPVYAEIELSDFYALQSMVGLYLKEAASKQEDAVATYQFYNKLAQKLENYIASEPDIDQMAEKMKSLMRWSCSTKKES